MKKVIALVLVGILIILSYIGLNESSFANSVSRRISIHNMEKALPPEKMDLDVELSADYKNKRRNASKTKSHSHNKSDYYNSKSRLRKKLQF